MDGSFSKIYALVMILATTTEGNAGQRAHKWEREKGGEGRRGGGKGENAQQTSSYAPKAEPTQEAH